MTEQAAVGGGNEGTPGLGDVRFEGDELLTFDGTSWVPVARVADTGPGSAEIFRLGPGAAKSETARDGNLAPDTAGNESAGQ
jgi:hypothetical protein